MKKLLVFMMVLAMVAAIAGCSQAPATTATPEPTVEPTDPVATGWRRPKNDSCGLNRRA